MAEQLKTGVSTPGGVVSVVEVIEELESDSLGNYGSIGHDTVY